MVDDCSSFGSPRVSEMSEKHLYIHIFTQASADVFSEERKGHTSVALVPRSGCLSSVILPPHFLKATVVYTLTLGRLGV